MLGLFLMFVTIPVYILVFFAVLEDRPISKCLFIVGSIFGAIHVASFGGWTMDWGWLFGMIWMFGWGVLFTPVLWGPTLLFIIAILSAGKLAGR